YYTLANTMLGTMTVLADGGISSGTIALGGTHWQDRTKLGSVLATGMQLRRQFAVFSLLISIPILLYLLRQQGLGWTPSILLSLSLIPTFMAALSGSLLEIVPRLHQEVPEILKVKLGINVWRLLLLLPVLFLGPFASLAILAGGGAQLRGNHKLRQICKTQAELDAPPNPEYRREIFQTVKKILPISIYYCVSGQITIWLISIFGSTTAIAQIGALSRLAVLLAVVKMCFDMLLVPRFARLRPEKKLIFRRYFQVVGLSLFIGLLLSIFFYFFPQVFLFVLGENYADLEAEVFLMVVGACLTTSSSVAHSLGSSRGIIPNPALFVLVIVLAQAITIVYLIDYTTLAGVIKISIFTALTTITYRIIDFLHYTKYRFNHVKES
ncbi:MAG: polysaccharide biosynthesis protein, partial [Bacteroidota bacterium]